jgi:hypothetical protein
MKQGKAIIYHQTKLISQIPLKPKTGHQLFRLTALLNMQAKA